MASKTALFFAVNLLLFVIATSSCPPPKAPPPSPPKAPPPSPPKAPPPSPPKAPPPSPPTGGCPPPTTSSPPPTSSDKCPIDTLKLGACANVLGLINVKIGSPPTSTCCSLLGGLVDLEAAVCLCTALKANILGINLNVPISLSLLLNYCGKDAPSGFQCG